MQQAQTLTAYSQRHSEAVCVWERSCVHIKVHTICMYVGIHCCRSFQVCVRVCARVYVCMQAKGQWPCCSPSRYFLHLSGNLFTHTPCTLLHIYVVVCACVIFYFIFFSLGIWFCVSLPLRQVEGQVLMAAPPPPFPSAFSHRETRLCQMSC